MYAYTDFDRQFVHARAAQFRDQLGDASGFQSVSYRKLEFVLGNKNPAMVAPHRNSPSYEEVRAQLLAPSLYDETLAFLHRRGLAIPKEVVDRDFSTPYEPNSAVEEAWQTIYRDPVGLRDLYLLAEGLMDIAEQFARFMGTARFLIYMTAFVGIWVLWNALTPRDLHWDDYPFIFLTLMLSLQASYAAPLILLAQNRQEQRDKVVAEQDRQANARAHADMEFLAREVASLRMAVGEVATRDFLRSELRSLRDDLVEDDEDEPATSA